MSKKRDEIDALLRKASASVSGARVRVTDNADGTIDGEVFMPISHGESLEEKMRAVEDTLRDERITNTWAAAGFRFEPNAKTPTKADYNRHRGMFQVFSNYYRRVPDAIDVVDDIVAGKKGMRVKGYRKPIQAIVRVHWNKYGIQPPREGGK